MQGSLQAARRGRAQGGCCAVRGAEGPGGDRQVRQPRGGHQTNRIKTSLRRFRSPWPSSFAPASDSGLLFGHGVAVGRGMTSCRLTAGEVLSFSQPMTRWRRRFCRSHRRHPLRSSSALSARSYARRAGGARSQPGFIRPSRNGAPIAAATLSPTPCLAAWPVGRRRK
jgi:hypothetical protein